MYFVSFLGFRGSFLGLRPDHLFSFLYCWVFFVVLFDCSVCLPSFSRSVVGMLVVLSLSLLPAFLVCCFLLLPSACLRWLLVAM